MCVYAFVCGMFVRVYIHTRDGDVSRDVTLSW